MVEDRRLGELDEGQPVPGVIGIQQVAKVIAKLDDFNGINSDGTIDGLLSPPSNDLQGSIKSCLSVISKAKGLQQEAHFLFLYAATTTR